MKTKLALLLSLLFLITACTKRVSEHNGCDTGSVIFIHPDGTGLADWNATRLLYYGPDSTLNWDKLPHIGLYRSHVKDALVTSSHAGATIHSYGVKVKKDSYGLDGTDTITSRSGKKMSIMKEAQEAGLRTGVVNSGSIIEPGTGVFVSSETSRGNYDSIAKQIVQSGADVILSGGEEYLLPEGVDGKFCTGERKDSLNLIKWAEDKGYTVVYNRDELMNLPGDVEKVLGVFAYDHTFNDITEEELAEKGLQDFKPGTPTVAEMTDAAIKVLSRGDKRFFLVVEEEATDNFANRNNARGMLQALKNADDAIGAARDFLAENPKTLIITAADSEAGGIEIIGYPKHQMPMDMILPEADENGSPVDGINGTGTRVFHSKPDRYGNSYAFALAWSSFHDTYGGVVARAEGINSELMKGSIDNTDIYKIMYVTLFGELVK